jgi:hypothetical protein
MHKPKENVLLLPMLLFCHVLSLGETSCLHREGLSYSIGFESMHDVSLPVLVPPGTGTTS